jgi:drug/metabolite transporter (DMT)-like permease
MKLTSSSKQNLAIFGLLAITAIWGSTFILVKWTVESIGVYFFLFLRFTFATLLLILIFHRRMRTLSWHTIKASLLLSCLMFTVFATQTEGLRLTTASNSALITGLYMVLVPLFSLIYPRGRPDPLAIVGIALALVGMILLTQYSFTGLNGGDLITIVTACACAWHIILTGQFATEHSIIPLVVYQFIFVSFFSLVATIITGQFTSHIPQIGWITIIITAVFATALAFTVQTAAQRIVNPTRTGIIFAMEAVFGALFGYLIGGELMTQLSFVGACLMVGGMFVSEIKPIVRFAIDKIVG